MSNEYSDITPEILDYAKIIEDAPKIDPELYTTYQVNRGLRDVNGKGVLTGLTEISEIQSHIREGDQLAYHVDGDAVHAQFDPVGQSVFCVCDGDLGNVGVRFFHSTDSV